MQSSLFSSFWMAGFEAAYHKTRRAVRLDMIAATQHDSQVEPDYAQLAQFGMRTLREAARWHLIDTGSRYDLSSLEPFVEAANRHSLQVIWTLCHYGWPDGLDLFSPEFPARFGAYSRAVAKFLWRRSAVKPMFLPVNEISFLSWAAGRHMFPAAKGRDGEIKLQLVRAAIAACAAVSEAAPKARLVHAEPLIHVVHPKRRPHLAEAARAFHEAQFDAYDMIAGRKLPELGGRPEFLDIVGANYYHDNQWELEGKKIWWHEKPRDPRYIPLRHLLADLHARYQRPVFLAETSHFGVGRARWVKDVAVEVAAACNSGVPVEGICLYPILDRHDWQDPTWWHHSGLWDLHRDRRGHLRRELNRAYATGLLRAQQIVAERCEKPGKRRAA